MPITDTVTRLPGCSASEALRSKFSSTCLRAEAGIAASGTLRAARNSKPMPCCANSASPYTARISSSNSVTRQLGASADSTGRSEARRSRLSMRSSSAFSSSISSCSGVSSARCCPSSSSRFLTTVSGFVASCAILRTCSRKRCCSAASRVAASFSRRCAARIARAPAPSSAADRPRRRAPLRAAAPGSTAIAVWPAAGSGRQVKACCPSQRATCQSVMLRCGRAPAQSCVVSSPERAAMAMQLRSSSSDRSSSSISVDVPLRAAGSSERSLPASSAASRMGSAAMPKKAAPMASRSATPAASRSAKAALSRPLMAASRKGLSAPMASAASPPGGGGYTAWPDTM